MDVVGRPTGYAGEHNERAWKAAVRTALGAAAVPVGSRLALEVEFRLRPDQIGHEAPDLDNLIKSTIDALDDLIGARPIQGREQADDERIDRITASKRLAVDGEDAGARIVVTVIG